MAYTNWTNPGSTDNTTGDLELFKVIFGTQIMANFKKNLVFGKSTLTKTLTEGKAYEWNLLSEIKADYHTPGTAITAQKPVRGVKKIYLDDTLYSAVEIPEIYQLMNHTDEMSHYSEEMGYQLALVYDKSLAAEVINGALVAPSSDSLIKTTNIGKGGTYIESKITGNASGTDDAAVLLKAILDLAKAFDKKDVPRTQRMLVLKPDYYWLLFNNIDLLNALHPGIGSIADGEVFRLAGFTLIMSTNIPNAYNDAPKHEIYTTKGDTDVVIGNSTIQHYGLKYDTTNGIYGVSKIAAVAYRPNTAGTVKLKGLAVSTKWHDDYFAWLTSSRMIVGHGWLNPATAGLIIDNDPSSSVIVTA